MKVVWANFTAGSTLEVVKLLRFFILLSIIFVGCQKIGIVPMPDSRSTAAQLYISKCSTCHQAPHPARHYYSQWIERITLMEYYMEQREMAKLTETEKEVILQYLKNNARKGF